MEEEINMSLADKIVGWRIMSEKELKEQKNYRINHLKSAIKGNYEVELEHRISLLKNIEEDVEEFIQKIKEINEKGYYGLTNEDIDREAGSFNSIKSKGGNKHGKNTCKKSC